MIEADRALLRALRDAGVTLTVDGDRLKYRAPKGTLTADLREALTEVKPTVLYEYHERAGILEYDGRLPRRAAEERAACLVLNGGGEGRT